MTGAPSCVCSAGLDGGNAVTSPAMVSEVETMLRLEFPAIDTA